MTKSWVVQSSLWFSYVHFTAKYGSYSQHFTTVIWRIFRAFTALIWRAKVKKNNVQNARHLEVNFWYYIFRAKVKEYFRAFLWDFIGEIWCDFFEGITIGKKSNFALKFNYMYIPSNSFLIFLHKKRRNCNSANCFFQKEIPLIAI